MKKFLCNTYKNYHKILLSKREKVDSYNKQIYEKMNIKKQVEFLT